MSYFLCPDENGNVVSKFIGPIENVPQVLGYLKVTKTEFDNVMFGYDKIVSGLLQKGSVLDPAYGQVAWARVRSDRDTRLAVCDWTQTPDSPLIVSKKTAWAVYRQALRDITIQSDPSNITWPTPPV